MDKTITLVQPSPEQANTNFVSSVRRTRTKRLHHIAKQANYLETMGNFSGSDRLRVLLEEHNCCLVCGTEQVYDPEYYKKIGMWKCPTCDRY